MAKKGAVKEHDAHGHHPDSYYVKIWAILLVLLLVSIAGPEAADVLKDSIGELGAKALLLITAFGIALVKALMVAAYFMHLNIEKKIIWYLLIISLVFLAVFYYGVAPDVLNNTGTNWVDCTQEGYTCTELR